MKTYILWISLIVFQPLISQLPEPSGAYCVGKWVTEIEDPDRLEDYTPENPSDFRRLVITAWYPSSCTGKQTAYIHPKILDTHKERNEISDSTDLSFILQTKTHAYLNAPVSSKIVKSPVLIFSHGSGNPAELYTGMLTHLASHGYFVFAISHTYNAAAVQFPGGEIVKSNRNYFKSRWTEDVGKRFESMMEFVKSEVSFPAKLSRIKDLYQSDFPASFDMNYWAKDISLTLDHIIQWNSSAQHKFYHHLNLKKIGGFGHSYGGSAMAHSLFINKKLKAVINLDGWQFGTRIPGHKFPKPFLYVRGGYENPDALNTAIYSNAGKKLSQIKIEGTLHSNFSDLPLFVTPDNVFKVGNIDGVRNHEVISETVRSYFEYHLNKNKKAWNELEINFPEVHREFLYNN